MPPIDPFVSESAIISRLGSSYASVAVVSRTVPRGNAGTLKSTVDHRSSSQKSHVPARKRKRRTKWRRQRTRNCTSSAGRFVCRTFPSYCWEMSKSNTRAGILDEAGRETPSAARVSTALGVPSRILELIAHSFRGKPVSMRPATLRFPVGSESLLYIRILPVSSSLITRDHRIATFSSSVCRLTLEPPSDKTGSV